MNTPALPAYLQNRHSQGVAARATSGMGGVLPPHISIRGNEFTLIDAAGNKQPAGREMDACVIDICDHMNKRYYDEKWKDGSEDPPKCWSMNGVGPSRESSEPQSPTCALCLHNQRGSATSALSGKGIKACRDEKAVALLLPQFPSMLFQLVIPPGSFKNWQAFTLPFTKGGTDVSDVIVRFGFQPQTNGVMTFQAVTYIDEATFGAREQALTQKATDVLVGRNDVPIAITHQPTQNPGLQTTQNPGQAVAEMPNPGTQQAVVAPAFGGAPQAQVPFGAPSAAAPAAAFGGTPSAAPASPSERAPRKRRTQAEIAADNAAKAAAQAGTLPPGGSAPVQPAPTQAQVSAQVPFPVNQPTGVNPATGFGGNASGPAFGIGAAGQPGFGHPAATPQPAGAQFGIQAGQDPNVDPQLAAMLATLGT